MPNDNVINALNKIVDVAEHISTINKRLFILLAITIISFNITFIAVSFFYFCNENSVPTITQSQSDNVSSNANIKTGGKN